MSQSSSTEINKGSGSIEPGFWNLRNKHNTFGLKGRKLRWAVTLTSVVGFSLFGYDQGLMSGIITAPQFQRDFPPVSGSSRHATVVQGIVTACYEIGCFFGALFAMIVGDRLGRRLLIIIGATIIIIGTFISIFPFRPHWQLGHFIIARSVTGIGNGMNTATIPVWQSEQSKPENRGRLVNLEGSVIAVGTLIAYWVDFGLSYANSSVSWRLPIALQILFALFLLLSILGLPESPRWLISKGRMEEARYILGSINDVDPNDDGVIAESTMIADAVNRFDNAQLGWRELFSGGKHQYFRRMMLGASAQFFQQFTGCNASIYYATVLFENTLDFARRKALVMGGIFSIVYAVFTIPSFFLIDRLGRRPLFLIGAAGQGVAFIIAFGCLVKENANNAKGAAVGLFLFIAFFAFTILPLPWVYPPEINALRARTVATSISTCTNWLSNFAVVMFTPIFINQSKWGCYLFFAIINFIYVPIIYFFYPETAGRSLEEIDIIFARSYDEGVPAFIVANRMAKLNNQELEAEGNRLGLFDMDDTKPSAELNEGILEKPQEPEV
ncbi:hypothetical protein OGAPHI_006806 [Ogataea philodendri]|uniref:Major facilitator superfamily (MFS) profile domain-containing protein n=1 Tax=Ogataea philodendri TaxID=1378263 RepID=A0A9P8T0P7_9ASCO|nr:uncharacterized protein OGAPHI_006806 [Ogataea philodendri]KAH3661399.1 hypothetical protein OGAPHI_006806 [Ogataea philodendri]